MNTLRINLKWQRRLHVLLLASSLFFTPSPSQAGILGTCVWKFRQLAMPFVVESYTGQTLRALSREKDSSELILGERIGLGDRGGLYRIQRSSTLQGIPTTLIGLVAKIPHTVGMSGRNSPNAQAELEMKREVYTYELLKSKWQKVEEDPSFPKDPAWKKGTIPTAPILKTLETRAGTILIKPEIQGESLKSLYERYKGNIPKEMKESLKDIYSTIQAVSHQVKTPIEDLKGQWTEGRPFYTDINPANLVWISNEAQLRMLGLNRPSFVFYEMTPLINRMPQYLPIGDSN
ncbi:MAG: hypothetical protein FJ112_00510 [Deltaproteobacteria bacterium]|nr:hypothetical protein [Deltaproteobacteria bacterium]